MNSGSGNHLYFGDNLSVLRCGNGAAAEMLCAMQSRRPCGCATAPCACPRGAQGALDL